MNIIKTLFLKIANGFLTGIGFVLVLTAFYFIAFKFFENQDYSDYSDEKCFNIKNCDEEHGLVVNITSEQITSEEFVLLGEVSNGGDIDWNSLNIKAELFDENDNFIEECKHYIDERVGAGSKVFFKLNCAQCSAIQLENYDSYRVKITDGSSY